MDDLILELTDTGSIRRMTAHVGHNHETSHHVTWDFPANEWRAKKALWRLIQDWLKMPDHETYLAMWQEEIKDA